MTPRVLILAQDEPGRAILAHTQETLSRFGVAHDLQVIDQLPTIDADIVIVANTTLPTLSSRIAAITSKPVLAVPVEGLEILQASADASGALCLAIGKAGAINAALLAISILANRDDALREKLAAFRRDQTSAVLADKLE